MASNLKAASRGKGGKTREKHSTQHTEIAQFQFIPSNNIQQDTNVPTENNPRAQRTQAKKHQQGLIAQRNPGDSSEGTSRQAPRASGLIGVRVLTLSAMGVALE